MGACAFVRARHGAKSGRKWRGLDLVQQVFGLCGMPSGAEDDEPLRPEKKSTKECGELLDIIVILEEVREKD